MGQPVSGVYHGTLSFTFLDGPSTPEASDSFQDCHDHKGIVMAKKPPYEGLDHEVVSHMKGIDGLEQGEVGKCPVGPGTLDVKIAHDFNNLLQAIAGNAQILLAGKDSAHPDYHKLKAIGEAVGKASNLIRRLSPDSCAKESLSQSVNSNPGFVQKGGILGKRSEIDREERMADVKAGKGKEFGGTETILLVDDDQNIRELLKEILDRFNYTVLVAQSGEESLEIYKEKKEKIDLVIMDLNMPGMGGRQCLRELLDLEPSLRVIISSGHCTQTEVDETMRLGASEFLTKPYHHSDLLQKIRKTLDE